MIVFVIDDDGAMTQEAARLPGHQYALSCLLAFLLNQVQAVLHTLYSHLLGDISAWLLRVCSGTKLLISIGYFDVSGLLSNLGSVEI
jgi:hypothetical protein